MVLQINQFLQMLLQQSPLGSQQPELGAWLRLSLCWVCAVNSGAAVSSCTPFLWGDLPGKCGAVLVAAGAPGCPTPPVDISAWGLLPQVGGTPWVLPRRKDSAKPWPQAFSWESRSRLAIPCSARKPLLLLEAENQCY